ncbi:fatty acid desaturase [Aestuariibaculum marinum]|uniref:Fatty acid desaturase n=2 Tax=Aestuariibaculum marinum TaxID=2683592 RepID=A0A8J6Q4J8_9FLAO|nr:fatty acid desaturase [Aestuariibaculum marinum]
MVLILPLVYIAVYIAAIQFSTITGVFYLLYAFLGIITVLIFMNIIHDAVHDNVFKKKWKNKALLVIFDLLGGNSYIWKKRHVLLHHNYQNIAGWDSDVEQAGVIRIFKEDKATFISRNQSWLIFIFYPLYLLNWLLVRDFKDFFFKNRTIKKVCKIPLKEYFKMIFFKGVYGVYIIGVPVFFGVDLPVVLLAAFIMLVTGSIFALSALLPPHVNAKNDFPHPDENGQLNISWLEHQFITTNDVTMDNWVSRYVMGNFNYHLAHHLFPNINSVYAPEVSLEIKSYAQEYGLNYRSYNLFKALYYHYQLIKENAVEQNFFEEDM